MFSFFIFYVLPFIVSLVLAFLLTALIRWWAIKGDIVDRPAPRKVHSKPIPLLGGLAVYGSFVLTLLIFWSRLLDGIIQPKYLIGIILGGLVLMIGGYLDDRYQLSPKKQILFPFLACVIVIVSGIGIKFITNPFGGYFHFDTWQILLFWWQGMPYYFTVIADLFTLFWLIGMIYVTKLLDGLDGLATGIGVIGSFIIFGVSLFWDVAQSGTSVIALALAGALLGFLIWNWHPAKIFLGEAGSTFIGFILGVLAIISGGKIATALLIMGIPILDVVWVIMRRTLFERSSMAQADRKHLHHRLLDIGFSHPRAVIFLYFVTGIFGLSSIFQGTQGKVKTLLFMIFFMLILAYYLVWKYRKTQQIDN
ncbi:MAG: MraY family glycosyltransferase [Candidatus Komeilibacteria bacterium]